MNETSEINKNNIINACQTLSEKITDNKDKLTRILINYESYQTISDEIERSLSTLNNIEKEFSYFPSKKVETISTFLPLNLPVYSLILFGYIPGLFSKQVHIRPPLVLYSIIDDIFNILFEKSNLILHKTSREEYISKFVSNSSVVIFTGKYENAVDIMSKISKNTMFIHNGAGINPLLITESADINKAVKDSAYVKLFNSGQDCAGADAILVHSSIYDAYIEALIKNLNNVKIGEYTNPDNIVGPLPDPYHLINLSHLLVKNQKNIIYGGRIDYDTATVYPTVITANLNEKITFEEYFAPVFKIYKYDSEKQLDKFFQHTLYLQNAMYVSIYGATDYSNKIKNSVILDNMTIHHVEQGNKEYGGYSKKASFVYSMGTFHNHPVLISRDVARYYFNE